MTGERLELIESQTNQIQKLHQLISPMFFWRCVLLRQMFRRYNGCWISNHVDLLVTSRDFVVHTYGPKYQLKVLLTYNFITYNPHQPMFDIDV